MEKPKYVDMESEGSMNQSQQTRMEVNPRDAFDMSSQGTMMRREGGTSVYSSTSSYMIRTGDNAAFDLASEQSDIKSVMTKPIVAEVKELDEDQKSVDSMDNNMNGVTHEQE